MASRARLRLLTPLLLVVGVVGVLTFSCVSAKLAHAAPITGFNAGKIIDDAIFTNKNSMNTGQIQAFLNAKGASCTNGESPCLKNFSEGGRSAAQIIYDTGQQYNINPQVLIVLLQKEVGLVTANQPSTARYLSATGYGCPDSSPGVCNANYRGFTNQVRSAAAMFHAIMIDDPNRYNPYNLGNNTILWSPTTSCGSSTVNIQNRATKALYNYTPYRPNQAALDAGYGTGDACSTYGNRNFYAFFKDWFGSIRYVFGNVPANTTLYARSPCSIPPFGSSDIGRLYNPDSKDFLYTTTQEESCGAVTYGYIWDGVVMKNASGPDAIPVYRISNSERHIYTSSPSVRTTYLNNFGYKDEGIGFYVYAGSGAGRIPVQGLQLNETFFITSSGREAIAYQSDHGYYNFGTMYYTDQISTSQIPVYRITRNNSRLYTTSALEKSNALAWYGFADEGTISTNDVGPNEANMPTYRIRSATTGSYVYTTSRYERDIAVVNYLHISEGTAFYSLLWSNSPVHRAATYTMRIYTSSLFEYDNAAASYGYSKEGVGWYGY